MYNADDAVAKIDGYVVSVAGGGPHIGEKQMVRIEEAGRNSARATMLDAPASGDGLESGTRNPGRTRRGRRAAEPATAGSESKTD
jgi:ribonuclease G